MSNTEDWGPWCEIMEKIEDDQERDAEQAKLEEDYRHAEELSTIALLYLERTVGIGSASLSMEEIAALRFLTGIPRERK